MNYEGSVDCNECNFSLKFRYSIAADSVSEPEVKERVIAGDMFKYPCPKCGNEMMIMTPLAYWSEDWVTIVLAIDLRNPWTIEQVIQSTIFLLDTTRPSRHPLPSEVRLVGSTEQLQFMLKYPEQASDIRGISQVGFPNWDKEITMLEEIADAFLANNCLELAFVTYCDLINYIPDLWFADKVRHNFELISTALDDQGTYSASGRTPSQIYEWFRQERGEKGLANTAFSNYEVIWYTPGPGFEANGHPDFRLNYLVPSTFVQDPETSILDQTIARILLLLHSSTLKTRFSNFPDWINIQHSIIYEEIVMRWEKLTNDERDLLMQFYNQRTGRSLTNDLHIETNNIK